MIGTIVPAGQSAGRWLFVTRVDEANGVVYGRVWSAARERWTKHAVWYARNSIFRATPRCPKPRRPDANP